MSGQAEWSIFLRAIHSVLPAQLKEGTEVYAINEILTSYSFVRWAGIRRYCPCTHSYSVSISYVCVQILGREYKVSGNFRVLALAFLCCPMLAIPLVAKNSG